jgi:hypothetical protein
VGDNIHNRHSRNLPDPSLEVLIAGSNDKATMLFHPFDQTIISIRPLVVALQPLEPRILGNPQGQSVLHSKLLQFGNDTVSDVGNALAKQAVHTRLEDVQLVLDGEVDEVGIDEDAVGRTQGVIVSEEKTGRLLGTMWEGRYSSRTSTSSGACRTIAY